MRTCTAGKPNLTGGGEANPAPDTGETPATEGDTGASPAGAGAAATNPAYANKQRKSIDQLIESTGGADDAPAQ